MAYIHTVVEQFVDLRMSVANEVGYSEKTGNILIADQQRIINNMYTSKQALKRSKKCMIQKNT